MIFNWYDFTKDHIRLFRKIFDDTFLSILMKKCSVPLYMSVVIDHK